MLISWSTQILFPSLEILHHNQLVFPPYNVCIINLPHTLCYEEERQQRSFFHLFTHSVSSSKKTAHPLLKMFTSEITECPSLWSMNSKLTIESGEHIVQPDGSRQTQIPCQRPSHPSNPDPHQGPGPGPRPWPSAHQTDGKKRYKKQRQERENRLSGKLRLHFMLFNQHAQNEAFDTHQRGQSLLNQSQSAVQHLFTWIFFFVSKKCNIHSVLFISTSAVPDIKLYSFFSLQHFIGYTWYHRKVPGVAAEWQKWSRHLIRTEMGPPEAPWQTEHSKHCVLQTPKGKQTK